MFTPKTSADELAERVISPEARKTFCKRFGFERWARPDRISYWRHYEAIGGWPSEEKVAEHMNVLSRGRSYNSFDLMTRWLCGEKEMKTYTHLYKKAGLLDYSPKEKLYRKPELD